VLSRSVLGKCARRFAVALALIPPFYEVASFRMILVSPTDADVVFLTLPLLSNRAVARTHLSLILTCLRSFTRDDLAFGDSLDEPQ